MKTLFNRLVNSTDNKTAGELAANAFIVLMLMGLFAWLVVAVIEMKQTPTELVGPLKGIERTILHQ